MKQIWTIFLLFSCVLLTSCLSSSSSETSASDVAKLNSFYFAANDSFPGLKEAKFTIKELLDTGLVYNQDSIRYGTSIRRVVPKFSFAATPYTVYMRMLDSARGIDTTFTLGYSDTLNLECEQMYLHVISGDRSKTKVYRIEVRVHQVDPDLYSWQTLSEAVYPADDEEQQLLKLAGRMLIVTNDGSTNRLYESTDKGGTWSSARSVTGLPDDCRVRSIVSLHDSLFYVQDAMLYTSVDGQSWIASDCSSVVSKFHSTMLAWIDAVWVIAEDAGGKLGLYTVSGETVVDRKVALDEQFPVSGFAAVSFVSTSDRSRAMVMGGFSRDGSYLNSRWNLEYSVFGRDTLMRMTNYAKEQPAAPGMIGASLVWYNHRLHLFGGKDAEGKLLYADQLYCSTDEGMHWHAIDTAQCRLPESLTPRSNASMLVDDNTIYIYGGKSRTETFSDLYRTRLQSIDWETK